METVKITSELRYLITIKVFCYLFLIELDKIKFTEYNLISIPISITLIITYYFTNNWTLTNLFGICFSLCSIQLLKLQKFKTGIILLSGLFVYDIFWVFGTDVMVKVATNLDVPIKIIFPRNILSNQAWKFAMLGLGDIVVPGNTHFKV